MFRCKDLKPIKLIPTPYQNEELYVDKSYIKKAEGNGTPARPKSPPKKIGPFRVGNTERQLRDTWLEHCLLENQKKENELKVWGTRESSRGLITAFMGEVNIMLTEKKEAMGNHLELYRNKENRKIWRHSGLPIPPHSKQASPKKPHFIMPTENSWPKFPNKMEHPFFC